MPKKQGVQNLHTAVSQGLGWAEKEVKRRCKVLKKVMCPKTHFSKILKHHLFLEFYMQIVCFTFSTLFMEFVKPTGKILL